MVMLQGTSLRAALHSLDAWLCPAVMSSNGETNVVLQGVTHGAVDFLIKPVRIEELRNVWQHVVRRKRGQVRCFHCCCACKAHAQHAHAYALSPPCGRCYDRQAIWDPGLCECFAALAGAVQHSGANCKRFKAASHSLLKVPCNGHCCASRSNKPSKALSATCTSGPLPSTWQTGPLQSWEQQGCAHKYLLPAFAESQQRKQGG